MLAIQGILTALAEILVLAGGVFALFRMTGLF